MRKGVNMKTYYQIMEYSADDNEYEPAWLDAMTGTDEHFDTQEEAEAFVRADEDGLLRSYDDIDDLFIVKISDDIIIPVSKVSIWFE